MKKRHKTKKGLDLTTNIVTDTYMSVSRVTGLMATVCNQIFLSR